MSVPYPLHSKLAKVELERLYEKVSSAGEPPRHEANHGSVHQRLAARTQPLVIFAHPPVLVDPCQCPLHYPPPRQNYEALGGATVSANPRPRPLWPIPSPTLST